GEWGGVGVGEGGGGGGGGGADGGGFPGRRRKRAGEQHGLGLAVALVDVVAGALAPRLDPLRIHGFTRPETMAQGGELILRERLLHEHAVGGGRREERGDRIACEHLERGGRLA